MGISLEAELQQVSLVDVANDLLPRYDGKGLLIKLSISPNYKRLCPFHEEKTPSFWVWPQSNRYHCHGCGADGDVLDFVTHVKGSEELAREYLAHASTNSIASAYSHELQLSIKFTKT